VLTKVRSYAADFRGHARTVAENESNIAILNDLWDYSLLVTRQSLVMYIRRPCLHFRSPGTASGHRLKAEPWNQLKAEPWNELIIVASFFLNDNRFDLCGLKSALMPWTEVHFCGLFNSTLQTNKLHQLKRLLPINLIYRVSVLGKSQEPNCI
jgi:hypothetical protein